MNKFIRACLLFSVILLGANSVFAEAAKLKKTKTSSSSVSKKSSRTAANNSVVQGKPIELENGMCIVKYSLDRPSNKDRTYGFMYSIDWPVSGPEPLTSECRSFIASILDDNDIKLQINKNDTSILNFLEAKYRYYKNWKDEEFPTGDGDVLDDQKVTISADNKKTVVMISSDVRESYANGVHGEQHNKMFLNNGKALDFSMMPPEEVMMPLILKHLYEYGEPVKDTSEYSNLGYPDDPPVINNGKMNFDYGFWGGLYITSSVPVSEIIPLASPELLEFLE